MAMVNKLSILGVRSFDNTRSETIIFKPPLTLIVGSNGSGKTTIIECLKYSTTGELPPNAKQSGAFIHDPKLCGEKEVLAQVKLGFDSVTGARMVATRSLQVTVKKNTRTQKALEGSILISKDGHKTTISSRVAEMDSQMPQYLGVSRAILDSVIFCHQEESLWPLAEPSKLKQRFDEIFEAVKYKNAVENIKLLAKRQKDALVKYKKDEEHTKVIKDKAKANEKKTKELYDSIEKLRGECEAINVRLEEAKQKQEEAESKAAKTESIVEKLTGKRIAENTKQESVDDLKETITEMSDSDDDLQRILEQYDDRVRAYEEERDAKTKRYHEISAELTKARENSTLKQRECGKYENEKDSHDRQVEQRERLIKETARRHNIRGFDMEVDDAQVQAFMDRISKMARDQNAAFERTRRETSEELQRAQKVVSEINEKKSALNQRKQSARDAISTNDRNIATKQTDLNNIDIDEGGKAAMESNLRETEARLESAKSSITSSNWDSSIDTAEAELRRLDDRKEKLDAELVEGTRQAGDSARLDFTKRELKDRQRSLETMMHAHGEKVSSIVGQNWTPASLDSDFERSISQTTSDVAEAEEQRNGTNHEIEQVEFKLSNYRSELSAKRASLKAAEKAIRDALSIEPADYPEEVKKIEESRDIQKIDAEGAAQLLEYFSACIKTGKDQNACRTCNRKFNNSNEHEKMLKTVESLKAKFENPNVKQELEDIEDELKAARNVSTDFDTWERLKQKEIPALEKDEGDLAAKRERLIRQLEDQDLVVNTRQSAKRDIAAIQKTVQTITRYNSEIATFEEQIKDLAANQKAAGMSRGIESIQGDMKEVNNEIRAAKNRLGKATGDRDNSKTLINTLELEYRDIKNKLSTAEYQLKEKKSLESQVEEYKRLNIEQREAIKSIDQDLEGLSPQLSQAQANYDDIARRGEDKDRELQIETAKLNSSLSDLKKADKEIKAYTDEGGPGRLNRANREFHSLQDEITRLDEESSRTTREVNALLKQLQNVGETKRSITDNQRYRRDLRALHVIREEIRELESHNAEEDKIYHEREAKKWQMERNMLSGEHSGKIGIMKTKDNHMNELIEEFDTDYKDAGAKFKEAQIMVQTTKASIDDLSLYSGALDKAIMKYHSLKMEQVNKVIEELWRETYQGTDVDTIMIKSESEGGRSPKSYNYRLVMVKQDAEMDMRGRCSAGQKVLASIIIRLALAETFGNGCGMIALDEPTTNLDFENIKALAKSLNKIIKARKTQSNFQLIVITHDEGFLREMQCGDFADTYWRVSRNAKQKSIIEKQSISAVSLSCKIAPR